MGTDINYYLRVDLPSFDAVKIKSLHRKLQQLTFNNDESIKSVTPSTYSRQVDVQNDAYRESSLTTLLSTLQRRLTDSSDGSSESSLFTRLAHLRNMGQRGLEGDPSGVHRRRLLETRPQPRRRLLEYESLTVRVPDYKFVGCGLSTSLPRFGQVVFHTSDWGDLLTEANLKLVRVVFGTNILFKEYFAARSEQYFVLDL